MTLAQFKVGKPFPAAHITQQGIQMELWSQGLICQLQFPGLQKAEKAAFKKIFKSYSYFESSTPVPIAIWIFKFPPPIGTIDCPFTARIAHPQNIDGYLDLENGERKNMLTFYLLDGSIIRGIKVFGLNAKAVELFHNTINKQLSSDFSNADYNRYVDAVYQYNSDELFEMGTKFKAGKKL